MNLEIVGDDSDAIAVIIYVTLDNRRETISKEGTVFFADGTTIDTGDGANFRGIWLFPVPNGGVFADESEVEYVRKTRRK